MPTLAEAQAHRAAAEDISTLALAELVNEWDALPVDSPTRLAAPLAALLRDLVGDFGPMVGAVAADWYEQLRLTEANLSDTYTALLGELPADEVLTDTAGWASSAAYIDTDKALHDAGTALDRLLLNVDRGTIETNVDRDQAAPRFARYASPNACAFCAMNASRGPIYRSEESAAGKYHRSCRCIAVPVWDARGYHEAAFVAGWRDAYHAAREAGASDTKSILAHMRANAGLR